MINAVTKSGGNTFSGTGRINLESPSWSDETPFEDSRDITRIKDIQQIYEGTLGGPIVRNRLWFFGAGRSAETSVNSPLPESGAARNTVTTNRQGELKLTGYREVEHTFQGGFLNNPTTQLDRPSFSFSIDPRPSRTGRPKTITSSPTIVAC